MKQDWDEMDQEEQINALREKLNLVIAFIDNHQHTADGFTHSKEGIYSVVKGSV